MQHGARPARNSALPIEPIEFGPSGIVEPSPPKIQENALTELPSPSARVAGDSSGERPVVVHDLPPHDEARRKTIGKPPKPGQVVEATYDFPPRPSDLGIADIIWVLLAIIWTSF